MCLVTYSSRATINSEIFGLLLFIVCIIYCYTQVPRCIGYSPQKKAQLSGNKCSNWISGQKMKFSFIYDGLIKTLARVQVYFICSFWYIYFRLSIEHGSEILKIKGKSWKIDLSWLSLEIIILWKMDFFKVKLRTAWRSYIYIYT